MICLLPGQGLVGLMGRQFLLDRLKQGLVTLQCRLLTPTDIQSGLFSVQEGFWVADVLGGCPYFSQVS